MSATPGHRSGGPTTPGELHHRPEPARSHPLPAPRAAHSAAPHSPSTLRRAAERVLQSNWTGTSTVPSRGLYPHQWSWDSAFIAIGLRHIAPDRARGELTTLFGAQWGDGRVPHIVFAPQVPTRAYFPSPDFWRSSVVGATAGAPSVTETSGLVQPPVHALAAWLVHEADRDGSARSGFLEWLYPRLAASHRYLASGRDLSGSGLAAIVHPWESGMDNSPCWDGPLARVTPSAPESFRRADLDHGAAEDRPTDLDYGRYVALAIDYRDASYQDAGYGDRQSPGFAVEDPGFNALLISAEYALARIARELHRSAEAATHQQRAAQLTGALLDHLWSPETGLFHGRDVHPDTGEGRPLPDRSAAGLLPLLAPELPAEVTGSLLRTVTGEHFGLGSTTRMVPSYDLTGPEFHHRRYWRGPAWFNVNWLLERGLRQHGAQQLADDLRENTLRCAGASDFAEYLDPHTGEPYGACGFSWTAALAVDLLADRPADGSHSASSNAPVAGGVPAPRGTRDGFVETSLSVCGPTERDDSQ